MQDFHYIHILCKNAVLIKSGGDFCSVNSAGALIKTMIFISLLQWDLTDLQS